MYEVLKLVHLGAAILTISGFTLRGIWMMADSPLLRHPLTRVLPHVVDSVFLLSGIGLIVALRLPVMSQPWLITKLVALVAYVLLGTIALKRGRTRAARLPAFILALATFAYIVGVALYKSPSSWLVII